MAQKYKDIEERDPKYYTLRKGVTVIHLFKEEWRIGRLNEKTGKVPHVVIYAPNEKLYHAYGDDALKIFDARGDGDGYHERSTVDKAQAKIWILTNVLDEPDYWNFNTDEKPEIGMPVKVVYENGTIKWIDSFTGLWPIHKGRYDFMVNEVEAWRIKGTKK
jgi:hypothetical protein